MSHFYNKFHHRETLPCAIQNCHPANWPIRLLEFNMRYNKWKCGICLFSRLFHVRGKMWKTRKKILLCNVLYTWAKYFPKMRGSAPDTGISWCGILDPPLTLVSADVAFWIRPWHWYQLMWHSGSAPDTGISWCGILDPPLSLVSADVAF